MDIVAHALWAGSGIALLARRRPIRRRTVWATLALAVLPDILQLLPIAAWILFSGGSPTALMAYTTAMPERLPALPPWVLVSSEHLHCLLHSAVVAGAVTALLFPLRHVLWLPLLGWWSHIVIDVFTHSADYYPSPVLYPFTLRGFDGVAWISPWFMVGNYAALALVYAWLVATRRNDAAAAAAARSPAGNSCGKD